MTVYVCICLQSYKPSLALLERVALNVSRLHGVGGGVSGFALMFGEVGLMVLVL